MLGVGYCSIVNLRLTMKYTCPYCGDHSTVGVTDSYSDWVKIVLSKSQLGEVGLSINAITCPNPDCKKLKLWVALTGATRGGYDWIATSVKQEWQLLPESEAKVLPDYIPAPIVQDYQEACRIKILSPKASATLSRRCLQGMIRDFYRISKPRLVDEINELQNVVDSDVWDSIEAVRKVGNIGAHMERDIDIIVDVDPMEAQLLISLIEQLVEEWYVTRENRKNRSSALKKLAEDKGLSKKAKVKAESE